MTDRVKEPAGMTMANSFEEDELDALSEQLRQQIARRTQVLSSGYRLFYSQPLAIVRGEGSYVYDDEGREYLDAYNNVPGVGHSHPHVTERVAQQLSTLNIGNRYLQDTAVEYSERLLATMGAEGRRVMYTCSGSEANDLAYRVARGATGRRGIVVTRHAYHGVTDVVASFSPSLGPAVPLAPFVRLVDPPRRRPQESDEAVGLRFAAEVESAIADLQRHGEGIAAFICDSVFSSDGVHVDPPGVLRPVVDVVRRHGGLIIADEVQSGFCRTGEYWWGFQRHGIDPDIVTMGKAMGNGMPISAAVIRAELDHGFGRGSRYVSTYGGISVCIAAAGAVLDVIESEALAANAVAVGDRLAAAVSDVFDSVGLGVDIRHAGLYLGAEPLDPEGSFGPGGATLAKHVVEGLRERRVLASTTGSAGEALKIRPPLVFSADDADRFSEALRMTLTDLKSASAGRSVR